MICDSLHATARYLGLGPGFAAAFDYLRRTIALGAFEPGRTVIVPNDVWASAVQKNGRAAEQAGFEFHEQFADVHVCLRGCERIGWRADARGLTVRSAFNAAEDFGLYHGSPEEFFPLVGERFAVFFPGELHAPLIGDGELTKICVKVRCTPSA